MKKYILTSIILLLAAVNTAWAQNVAQIGTTEYATLAEAVAAVQNNETITLLSDANVTSMGNIEEKTGVVIDLNGKTIYLTANNIHINKGSVVTIKNGTIDITGNNAAGDCIIGIGHYNNTANTLTLDNITLTGNGYSSAYCVLYAYTDGTNTLNVNNSTIDLKNDNSTTGGIIKGANATGGIINVNNSKITGDNVQRGFTLGIVNITNHSDITITNSDNGINQSVLTIEDSKVTITNGSGRGITSNSSSPVVIKGNSTVILSGNTEGDLRLDTGCSVSVEGNSTLKAAVINENGGTAADNVNVDNATIITGVAKIGTTGYFTLEEAITAATAGETIVLTADIDATAQILVDKKVTLDLNGHIIEYKGTSELSSGVIGVKRGGELTITDSSDPSTGAIKSGSKAYAAVAMTTPGEAATGDAAKLTVESGTLEGYYYAITGNGTRHGTEITINGGVIKGTYTDDNCGIFHPQDGTLTIKGGSIEGYSTAVELRSGTLSVSGGTFTATCPTYSCNPNGSGTTTKGAAIAIAQHTTNKAINAEITGGSFTVPNTAGSTAVMLSVSNPQNNAFSNVTVKGLNTLLAGGVETPEGYVWKDNGDETSSLAPAVAQIDPTYYATLEDAIEAANDQDIIELLSDITLTNTVTIDKSIVIDGYGHTVTNTSNVAFELIGNHSIFFNDLVIKATNSNGIAIQAGKDGNAYAGKLGVYSSTLTAGKRGVSIYEPGGNIELEIENTTIQSTVADPTTTYVNDNTRGISLVSSDVTETNSYVLDVILDDTDIKGFAYCINVVGKGETNIGMSNGSTYGRAAINNWSSNGKFLLKGVDVHGLNNETGSTEAFACLLDNETGENNTFNIDGCTFTATLSDAAKNAVGGNASEYLVALRGQNAKVYITGNTTYTSNAPEGRKGLIQNEKEEIIDGTNSINFDGDAVTSLANIISGLEHLDAVSNGNGTYSLAPAVAQIGTTKYASLKAAVDAAQTGDVITMIDDDYVSLTNKQELVINKAITITGPTDENGIPMYTINGTSDHSNYNDLYINCTTGTVTISNVGIDGFGCDIVSLTGHAPVCIGQTNKKVVLNNVYISGINCEGIHINGGEFEITNCYIDASKVTDYSDYTKGICVVNAATGSITGTTIEGVVCELPSFITAGIELQGKGAVTIEGCEITATGDRAAGIVANSAQGQQPGASMVTVSDCTVSSSDYLSLYGDGETGALISVTSGTYNGPLLAVAGTNSQGLAISGGSFSEVVPAAYCAPGYEPVTTPDATGRYTVTQAVARIGSLNYATLQDAVDAVPTDGTATTIELLADIDATAQIVVDKDKQVTLDLNGHTIEYKGTSELKSGVIGVKRGGDLTITDSSNPSTGAIKSGNKAYAAVAMTIKNEAATGTPAKLTVESGTLEGYYYAITGNGTRHDTEITINGGVIKGTCTGDNCGIYHPQDGTLTITGGTIEGYSTAVELRSGTLSVSGGTFTATCPTYSCSPNGNGTTTTGAAIAIAQHTTNKPINATISGGTFVVFGNGVKLSVSNPQNNAFSNVTVQGVSTLLGESVTVPEGYAWKDNGNGTSSLAPAIAKIGDTNYASLKDAIAAIQTDGVPRTIVLLTDIAQDEQLVIADNNKNITIDLNNHSITATMDEPFKVTGNNIGLTFTGTGEISIPADGNDDVVAMRGENGHLVVGPGVTLTEGTIFVRGKNNVVDINGKVNVTGNQAAIQTTGSDTNTGNIINVNEPAVITSEDLAIYAAGDASYNIKGGSVTGATAIYIKSGKLTVTDGAISGNGAKADYVVNNDGANATGDGIVVDNCGYPGGAPEVTIKGGTISSTNADPVASYNRNGQPKVTGFIYAGFYNKDFDASLLAPGYVLQTNESGMYTPVTGAGVAKIGDVFYQTLNAAIADVPTDGTATTIELLTNINAAKRTIIPSNTNITLDLGGFTLRCDDDFAIAFFDGAPGAVGPNKTQNAQLTVKDGTVTSKKSYAIRTDGTGNKLTIAEDATVKAGSETDYALVVRGSNTEVTVNGTVEVLSGTAISTNGNDATNNNSITINAPAKITSPDDDAIYMPSGALTVNGGTITGATGIYFKGKTLTVPASSTAVITGTGKQRAAHYNGNGGDWTGDALVVDNANYPSGDPVPSVAGGTFISTHALPIASYATGATATAPTKFVSGGRFGGKIPASVIVDGYICKINDVSGYYGLEPGAYVAEVESIGYETFEEAVTAAGNEKVITLLANITGTYTMHEGQTLKIYKNGKNITVAAPTGFAVMESEEVIDGKTVTVYTLPKSIGPLVPANIRSDWTGVEQSAPLVITDGSYTLQKDTDYKLQDASGNDVADVKRTDVGPVTFKVVGMGNYHGEKDVTWTIYKNINKLPIRVEVDPAIYTTENIEPKDYVHVFDETTELELGADKDYTIEVATTIKDAKTYVNAITVRGTEKADKYIGGEVTFSMTVLPGDIKDMTADGNEQPWRESGYTAAQIKELISLKDNNEKVLVKDVDYTITVTDGTYKIVGTYEDIITITAKEGSNLTGTMKLNFTILPDGLIDIAQCVVTSKTVYNNLSQIPTSENIEVVYKNGYDRVVLDSRQFSVQLHGMQRDYVDAKTYSNAITLTGTTQTGTSNSLRFYGSVSADYVIAPRDLADTSFDDDQVEVVLKKNKDMEWNGNDLTSSMQIGDIAGNNNIFLYMKVNDNGYRYPLTNDATQGKYDYSYTVVPSPMTEPGEYKVLFTGRGNFTGLREVKINVLKDINQIAATIVMPLQVIPDNDLLKPSMLKDIEVMDGNKALELGVHYAIVIKDKSGNTTFTEDAPIKDDGSYQAIFQGLEPYYTKSIAKEMPVLFEYNHFAADDSYYNGHTSGYQIDVPVSIHVTSGKNLECQVGDKSGAALATNATSATLPAEATFILDNTTYTLKVVGIDNNAFDGAASIRYVDASAIKGFVPETLTREFDGPFKGLPKQALVFLTGSNIKGENYVYKPDDGAYYCELFKIYDDLNGSQTGFSGNDYKWAFENPHAFTAYTVENTRMLTAGKHYTTCLPYALAIPTSMKAYTLDATSNQIFGFREVAGTMAAYTPYVLIPTASGQLLGTTNVVVSAFTDVTQLTQNGTTKGNFTMYGTMRYMEGNDAVGKYIMQYGMDHKPTWLSIDEDAAGFNESNRACILSMRAYIEATASPARSYTAVFTDIDGVIRTETFTPDEEDTVIYDLQGRRVQNVTHGRLYIINGKKVMVK